MKKIGLVLLIILIVVIGFIYWSVDNDPKYFARSILVNIDNVEEINFRDFDSVIISASSTYKADYIKKIIQGEQYRDAWSAEVTVPIVYLDSIYGGLSIVKEGGGKQTHSLRLSDSIGMLYTMRSVNKDPEALVPEILKTLGLEDIVIDGISAQHPYGSILASELAKKANVVNTQPKVVFIPKQKTLETYNKEYGNRLYLLEYETEGKRNWTEFENVSELVDTEDLQELKLELKDSLKIDEPALVRSRLFDILIGDWDRHAKQWGWAIQNQDSLYIGIPIAGDRDNAFFNTDGIIPTLISNKNVVEELRPFKEDIDFIEGLVYPLDKYFLLKTPESVFIEQAGVLQELLSDNVLESSLKVWPENIRKLDGNNIIYKIKIRRDDLKKYALKFKSIINAQGPLATELKGSEDLQLSNNLLKCFQCN